MAKQILYLVYGGREEYRREAKFSILTALNCLKSEANISILIMTDQPEDFRGWPVEVEHLEREQLDNWLGAKGYMHRRKPCAIAAALGRGKDCLFVDTDTLFIKNPEPLFRDIQAGALLVDRFERLWKDAILLPEFDQLRAQLDRQAQSPPETLRLYNSGVCGIRPDAASLLSETMRLIDSWDGCCEKNHTIEQVALSFVLHGKRVVESKNYIAHYHPRKPYFRTMLKLFFERYGEAYRPELTRLCREVPRARPHPAPLRRLWVKWNIRRLSSHKKRFARLLLYGCLATSTPYLRACRHYWWDRILKEALWSGFQQDILSGRWPEGIPRPTAPEDANAALSYLGAKIQAARATQAREETARPPAAH